MGNYQNFEESEKRKFLSSYNKNPEDFYILRKVPISKHPILANLPFYFAQGISGDVNIIILKLYTSGSNYQRDNLIEIGMCKIKYSPINNIITELSSVYRSVEDPKTKISDEISLQTGLTNENIQGRVFNDSEIASFFAGTSIVVCHNAMFERQFFEKRFKLLDNLSWVSSLREIPWRRLDKNIRGLDLTAILYARHYFYDKTSALDETLALVWALLEVLGAFSYVIKSLEPSGAIIYAFGAPFDIKDVLRQNSYHWDGTKKVWYKHVLRVEYLDNEVNLLRNLYDPNSQKFRIKYLNASIRYKHNVFDESLS